VNLHASQVRLKQRKVSSHPSSSICTFPISPSLSFHLQTLRLVSLVSLIDKTKRIAERSDTNCDTHTHTHTHRQSTLDKYMINHAFLFYRAFRYSHDKNVFQSAMTLIAERPTPRFFNIIQYKFLKIIPERSIPRLRE
jgi:hypothetical protein